MTETAEATTDRKVAFVQFERRILLDLVQRHGDIVQDRRTDSNSVNRKQKIWLQITNEYNRHPNIVRRRRTQQLKRLWQNTRARAKQAVAGRALSLKKVAIDVHCRRQVPPPPPVNDGDDGDDEDDNMESSVGGDDLRDIDERLNPLIAVQLRKHENAIAQQSELHGIQMYREQLACKSLQEEMSRLADKHAHRMQCARELHELRMAHEMDRHAQQMRFEVEQQQMYHEKAPVTSSTNASYAMYK